jgi:cytochrome P450
MTAASPAVPAAPDLSSFNLFDPATQQCPWPHYEAKRERHPVFQVPGRPMWLVTRHDLVREVVRDVTTFSSQFGAPVIREITVRSAGASLGAA